MDRSKETLGPMVAHTTINSARLWMRAGESIFQDDRKFVARVFNLNSNEVI